MTLLLYCFQAGVVFLVPACFGWVVLRRVVREHDWLVVVPGSVVVGGIALMAIMNELRYWLEMSFAAWFAYKFLLAAGITLLVVTRRPRWNLQLAGGASRKLWMLLAVCGTAVTALYFGLPAARGILNDSWWFHYPAATLVQDLKTFPLPSPFAPDDPLYYHFGPDILAGTWAYLLNGTVQVGFVVCICVFAPSAVLLAYALILRGCRSHLGALAGATFLLVGGNLLFLRLPTADFSSPLSVIERLNSDSIDGLLKLMFTPSHACGIPAVLVAIVIYRHFQMRPSWPLAALLGLWLGALTLIAEWYFFPLLAAVGILMLHAGLARDTRNGRRAFCGPAFWLGAAPLVIALSWGFFNNTYVSGVFGHFWMRPSSVGLMANPRVEYAHFDQALRDAQARQVFLDLTHTRIPTPPPPKGALPGVVLELPLPAEHWIPPGLVPLKFNLNHFGMVPSWEGAGSSGGSFVRILSFRFIAECSPVIVLGLPFGLWLALRRPQSILRVLVLLAALSVLPPIFLDWGFRSTDFLRFFTGAFSFSALLLGWLVGYWWGLGKVVARVAAAALCCCVLINPFVIGLLGLKRSTVAAVQDVNQSAGSLQKAAVAQGKALHVKAITTPATSPNLSPVEKRTAAFAKLAEEARRYLYPLTLGRDRAIVIVPVDAIPPTEVFPEWLKLETLVHVQLPIGWYWTDSFYAGFYREAARTLSPASVNVLDARWVIATNLFAPGPPPPSVLRALSDPRRFVFARSFVVGDYYLNIYRASAFAGAPLGVETE